jgi:hypothetical protein
MKYEFHPLELTTKVNLKCTKKNDYQFIISYKYIEYKTLCHHLYKNSKYELLKLKFNSINNQKLKKTSNLLDQESNMQLHPSPF